MAENNNAYRYFDKEKIDQTVLQKAIDLIKKFEGFRDKLYLDPAGLPTIGYGTLLKKSNAKLYKNKTITEQQAEEFLKTHIKTEIINQLKKQTRPTQKEVWIYQHEFVAMISLAYNIGVNNFLKSTFFNKFCLFRGDNDLSNKQIAPFTLQQLSQLERAWKLWRLIKGVPSKGLINRREQEWQYFINKR